ncbi:hypothetical protein AC579_2835 [Pseudocercospora musae]|uniref:Metallo-beta-lactamase domain-containing protein n=1 Tax=Pseudocercospora musae TaxID=113226 RepID=A0A139GWG9_9PEZI|nr:hypothetical protein AC579_2835 [Pseudocercospora musae]
MEPEVHTFFEPTTQTWSWIVADPRSHHAVIINPVLDKGTSAGIATTGADRILELVHHNVYHITRILETHSQRDAQTAAWYLRSQLRDKTGQAPRICTGNAIAGVQRLFARQYGTTLGTSGFNSFQDGQTFNIGSLTCEVLLLSEQNPRGFAFVIGRNVFVGDVTHHGGRDANTPAFGRDPTLMKKLSSFAQGYLFHPPGGEERPQTSATMRTEVSSWQHSPVTPKGSINLDRKVASPRMANVYEME